MLLISLRVNKNERSALPTGQPADVPAARRRDYWLGRLSAGMSRLTSARSLVTFAFR